MSASPTVIVGNLTNDPELKFLESGTPKLTFGVAVNHFWTDADGQRNERTSYFNVVAWRRTAEDAARVLEKGMPVVISGRLDQRSYQTAEGDKRSVVEVLADDIGISARGLESVVRLRRAEGEVAAGSQRVNRTKQAVPAGVEPF